MNHRAKNNRARYQWQRRQLTARLGLLLAASVFPPLALAGCGDPAAAPASPTAPVKPTQTTTATQQEDRMVYYVAPDGSDAGPGTLEQPWKNLAYALEQAGPGDTVSLRGGTHRLARRARVKNGGSPEAWLTIAGYPGETAVIDAADLPPEPTGRPDPYRFEQGALHLEGVAYVRIRDLSIRNSHWAGICIVDCQHVDVLNNTIDGTYSSGISIWDTTRQGVCHHHRVLGNTVLHATTWDLLPEGWERGHEPPHEAISIAGANDFEVAWNHVYLCDKEGIDVKETSKRGVVHHNYVHHCDRQGLYADAWFGVLEDVEFHHNVVHDCRGSGAAVSVEEVEKAQRIHIHHNLLYDNWGTGVYFSRWGADGPRLQIEIDHNTIYRNGHGRPNAGEAFYYITGGVYLYSASLEDVDIHHNIISSNAAFQVGASEHYGEDIPAALAAKNIRVRDNLVYEPKTREYPVRVGWPGFYANVWPVDVPLATTEPNFRNSEEGDFRLAGEAVDAGANLPDEEGFWWKEDFPPSIQ